MDTSQHIEQLKKNILSGLNETKPKSVDELIELEGMKSMDFFQSIFQKDPFHKEAETYELHQIAGYGVNQLLNLRAKQSKNDFKFCCYCDQPLSVYEILDPFMIGLKCTNNHCFHIETRHGECKDKTLRVNTTKLFDIAKEWLTEIKFRVQIPNQVAEILRKYLEIIQTNDNENEEINFLKFCPVCGLALQRFEQFDHDWVQAYKCSNSHILYSRNGLSFNNAHLKPDIDKSTFVHLVNSYLEEKLSQYLPNQILGLLNEIKKNYS